MFTCSHSISYIYGAAISKAFTEGWEAESARERSERYTICHTSRYCQEKYRDGWNYSLHPTSTEGANAVCVCVCMCVLLTLLCTQKQRSLVDISNSPLKHKENYTKPPPVSNSESFPTASLHYSQSSTTSLDFCLLI